MASAEGHLALVKLLLGKGCRKFFASRQHRSCEFWHAANGDLQDKTGGTPLMAASIRGHHAVVSALLLAGATRSYRSSTSALRSLTRS